MRSSLSSLIALSGCVQYVRLEMCETHGNGNDGNDDDDNHDDETYPILYCRVVVCVLRAVHTCREAVAPNMSTDASPDM